MDWQMPIRSHALRNRAAVYSLPWSLLNRIRFNSDYAEDGVKPENLTMACSGGAC